MAEKLNVLGFFPRRVERVREVAPSVLPPSKEGRRTRFAPETSRRGTTENQMTFFRNYVVSIVFERAGSGSVGLLSGAKFSIMAPGTRVYYKTLRRRDKGGSETVRLTGTGVRTFRRTGISCVVAGTKKYNTTLTRCTSLFQKSRR